MSQHDLDKIGMKLHRGLIQMSLNENGCLYDPLYTTNGYLKWDGAKVLRSMEFDQERAIEEGTARIPLIGGVWQVPPEERAKYATRLDLVYPIS